MIEFRSKGKVNTDIIWYFDETKISVSAFDTLNFGQRIKYLSNDQRASIKWIDGAYANSEHWYSEGKLHREDGPAVITSSNEGYHYLWGEFYEELEYNEAISYLEENGRVAFTLRYFK